MAKLGTSKRPAVARVQTMERAGEIMALCEEHGWKVVVGVEPDKPEDISDVERLLNPNQARRSKPRAMMTAEPKVGRNDPCPCGSGLKYKQCCLRKRRR
jgi:SWIM/SEC-C metal-binding protein